MVTGIVVLVLLSESKTQLVKPKKTTSGIHHRNRTLPKASPLDCDRVQLLQKFNDDVYIDMRPISRTK